MGNNLGIGSGVSSGVGLRNPSPALTGTPTAPTASLGTNTTQIATTAFVIANSPGSAASNWITQGRIASVSADGSNTGFNVVGELMAIQGVQGGGSPAATVSSANNNAAVATFGSSATTATGWNGNSNYRTGRNIRLHCEVGFARIVNARYWVGLTDQTFATMSASDNPAGNYAAFRFSTVASDTHIQAITKDNTTQTIVDTGVTPTAVSAPGNFIIFDIIFQDGTPNILFYVNSTLVATITTHLPTAGTNLKFMVAQTPNTNTTNMGMYLASAVIGQDNV